MKTNDTLPQNRIRLGIALSELVGSGPRAIVTVGADGALSLAHDGSPPAIMRTRIDELTRYLLSLAGATTSFADRTEHIIQGGMYMRRLLIPRGELMIGKIHRVGCMNVVARGEITVLTEHGCRRVAEGEMAFSPPGTQKVGLAHEDTLFVNVFRTDLTDLEEIEREIASEVHEDGGSTEYARGHQALIEG